ncbi:hypothetical protein Cantr_03464 [Candida viswanathii]|uniref:Uncharacterized protein n=1 Tax=Candida viswanathii TaxID=5486 RepID=A0A367YNA6_9ASCO|nr:hypothetical protein Cantr_03464 [Candida viswanathii]
MNDTSEWSFSLWDESLDIEDLNNGASETETTFRPESNEHEVEEKQPANQYNPFIICKMNSFKKKQTRIRLKIYTKYVRINTKKTKETIKMAPAATLNWEAEHKWIQRRGFPSEVLIECFCERLGIDKYQLRDSNKDWYIIGRST